MKEINFEKYKEEKNEYDNKIRKLDYKIVEESVKLYNLLNRSKAVETQTMARENEEKIEKLIDSINISEEEKNKLTKQIFEKFENLREELLQKINKIKNKDEKVLTSKIALHKIQDVYFDVEEVERIIKELSIEEKLENNEKIQEDNIKENIQEVFTPSQKINNIFDIPKQRVIDFENLLKYMNKISKEYRMDVEKLISKYITDYNVLNDYNILQNDFQSIKGKYNAKFNKTIIKFKKDENIEEINNKIQNLIKNNEKIENEIKNYASETQVMKEKVEKLQDVYLVHNYAKKVLTKFLNMQAQEDNNEKIKQKNDDSAIFKKIQKVTYDDRIKHIIEVSKWTKNIESKLKYQNIKEKDFQTILYLIRQTEDVCNINYENITNLILELCEGYIRLEEIELQNSINTELLKGNIEISNVLRDGINTIKKKYLKVPFIGRKVAYILDTKALNA